MNLSNDGLVAFHYRSYGAFFLQQNRLHNIYRDLPTTNIIEPIKTEQENLRVLFLFSENFLHFSMKCGKIKERG